MTKLPKIPILIILLAVALLALGGFYMLNKNRAVTVPGADNNTKAEDGTQYPGPTEQEKRDSQANKEKLTNQTPGTAQETGTKRAVTPIITSANQSEVRGFVPGIVENNGTCTARFTKGSASFIKESKGFSNVSNTNCEPIAISRSDFASAGNWSVTLFYSSDSAEGSSKPTTIEVK